MSLPGVISFLGLFLLAQFPLPSQSVARVEPRVLISGAREDLSGVVFVSLCGPNGTINVGLAQTAIIRRFTASGAPLGSFGRRGRGPGEFVQLGPFAFCRGDTLGVHDSALGRLTLVSPSDKLIRSIPLPRIRLPRGPNGEYAPIAAVPHGLVGDDLLVFGFNTRNPTSVTGHVLIVDSTGANARQVVGYPADPSGCMVGAPSGRVFGLPFCALSWVANDPKLGRVALVSSSEAQQNRGAFQVRLLTTGGAILYDREVVAHIDKIDQAGFEAELRRYALPDEGVTAVRRPARRLRYPTAPPVVLASDGSVWVMHRNPTANHWTVVSPTGRLMKEFLLDKSVILFAATNDRAIGVREDEDGFQDVVVIEPMAAARPH